VLRVGDYRLVLDLIADPQFRENIESIAAHLGLCLMKMPDAVCIETRSELATAQEREATLKTFTEWMTSHGWRVP
jgi:hypothetical protein